MWIKDPKTSLKSATLTFLVYGMLLASFKLLFSGMTIHGIVFSDFTGIDFGAVLAAVGGIYGWRKAQQNNDISPPIEGGE